MSRKVEGRWGGGLLKCFFFKHYHYLTQGFIFKSFILISLFYTKASFSSDFISLYYSSVLYLVEHQI